MDFSFRFYKWFLSYVLFIVFSSTFKVIFIVCVFIWNLDWIITKGWSLKYNRILVMSQDLLQEIIVCMIIHFILRMVYVLERYLSKQCKQSKASGMLWSFKIYLKYPYLFPSCWTSYIRRSIQAWAVSTWRISNGCSKGMMTPSHMFCLHLQ